jgi:hypothetical protein
MNAQVYAKAFHFPVNLKDFNKYLKEQCYPNSKISVKEYFFDVKEDFDGFILFYDKSTLTWIEYNNGDTKILKQFSDKRFRINEKNAIKYFFEKINDIYIDKYLLITTVETTEEKEKITSMLLKKGGVSSVTSDLKNGKIRIWVDNCSLGTEIKRF